MTPLRKLFIPKPYALTNTYRQHDSGSSQGDSIFIILLSISLITCILSGLGAGKYGIRLHVPFVRQTVIQTSFDVPPPTPAKKVAPKVPNLKLPESNKPVDLSVEKPNMNKQDEITETAAPETPQKPVRKVYGLRRVFSTGLGNAGNGEDLIVSKIGNTIHTSYDTITATDNDIKGNIVSVAHISAAPKYRKIVKPVYTKEMIDNKIQGTVKVKILVDIDGRVKKATCIDDIGFGSADAAVKASLAMEFEPGIRDNDPVAVWIIIPINFMLLS